MIITIIVVSVIVVALILIYNNLVGKKNQVANAFSSIDVLLKKRFDLIPNLTRNGETLHEARSGCSHPGDRHAHQGDLRPDDRGRNRGTG